MTLRFAAMELSSLNLRRHRTSHSMMAADHTCPRNVWFFGSSSKEQLGEGRQNGSITNKVFYKMLTDVLLTVKPINIAIPCTITLRLKPTGHLVPCNDDRLETGEYDIVCSGAYR